MAPEAMVQVLHRLPHVRDKDLLVGIETSDDAGVYRLARETALIQTLDFFPPIVDDPYTFGQIAAANAVSDVYAMGGTPRLAMNIVCFPPSLDLDILNDIMRGSMDKLNEAGVLLVGGHSIEDKEIKYGLSITGLVHPRRIITNRRARVGQSLVLTKPLGTGVITTALKHGRGIRETDDGVVRAIRSMKTLNRAACEVMVDVGVSACTDVTGYGLLGHAFEMCEASNVSMVIRTDALRFFPGARELVMKKRNRPKTLIPTVEFMGKRVKARSTVDEGARLLCYDPQTSGGLLIAVGRRKCAALMKGLQHRGVEASVIGEVVDKPALRAIVLE